MDRQRRIAILLCFSFFVLTFFGNALLPHFLEETAELGDFNFHYEIAKGLCEKDKCLNYPPMFHVLARPFTFRILSFWMFGAALSGFIIPLLLFELKKRWEIVWFYFAATNIFWVLESGYYPIALSLILLLLLFKYKSVFLRLGIVFLGIFAHSHAFLMLAFAFFVLLLFEEERLGSLAKVFPASAVFICKKMPIMFEQKIIPETMAIAENGNPGQGLTVGYLGTFLLKGFPLPFFLMSIYEFFISRNWAFIVMVAGGLFFMANSYRVSLFVSLILLFGLIDFYSRQPKKTKYALLALSLFTLIWELWAWFSAHIVC